MAVSVAQIRKSLVIFLILILIVLSFLILRPIIISIAFGLILAYAFFPFYKRVHKIFRERNTSALAVCFIIVVVVFVSLWFLVPLIVQQAFDTFKFTQNIDIRSFIDKIFPSTSEQFRKETTVVIVNLIGKVTSASLNGIIGLLLDLPNVLLHLVVIIFVFFFALRDNDKLKEFISGLSPFKKEKEEILIKKFKEITSSILFGYILVGVIQGVATGIGLIVFRVPHALLLTMFAMFAAVIPLVGAWLIWVPAAVYLFVSGNTIPAIIFTLYCALFVSSIDNILRPYIVSKKTGVPSVIVLVGMIGGLFVFGILGIILGPLILAYLILFLEAYKNKTLSDMFHTD